MRSPPFVFLPWPFISSGQISPRTHRAVFCNIFFFPPLQSFFFFFFTRARMDHVQREKRPVKRRGKKGEWCCKSCAEVTALSTLALLAHTRLFVTWLFGHGGLFKLQASQPSPRYLKLCIWSQAPIIGFLYISSICWQFRRHKINTNLHRKKNDILFKALYPPPPKNEQNVCFIS